jgi:hypothetical protein
LSYHKEADSSNSLWLAALTYLETSDVADETLGSLDAVNGQVESVCCLVRDLLGVQLDLALELRDKFFHFLVAAAQFLVGHLIYLEDLLDALGLLLNSGSNEDDGSNFSSDADALDALILYLLVYFICLVDSWLFQVESGGHLLDCAHALRNLLVLGGESRSVTPSRKLTRIHALHLRVYTVIGKVRVEFAAHS